MVIPGKPDSDEDVTRGAPTSWKVWDIGANAASAAVSKETNEQSDGFGGEQQTSQLAKVTLRRHLKAVVGTLRGRSEKDDSRKTSWLGECNVHQVRRGMAEPIRPYVFHYRREPRQDSKRTDRNFG